MNALQEKKQLRQQRKAEKARQKEERYYLASQWTLMARKLSQHKLARVSLVILGIFYFVALFGDFFAPYSLTAYDPSYKDVGPTKIHLYHEGKYIGPFVYKLTMQRDPETYKKIFTEDTSEPCRIQFFVQGEEYNFLGLFKTLPAPFGAENDAKVMLFGSTPWAGHVQPYYSWQSNFIDNSLCRHFYQFYSGSAHRLGLRLFRRQTWMRSCSGSLRC